MIPDYVWLFFALHGLEIFLMLSLGYWMLRSQRRADTQRDRQTDILEKLYNLQNKALRPQIQQAQQLAIVRCLLDSQLFDTPAARRNLLIGLDPGLVPNLGIGDGSALTEIRQILSRAATWGPEAYDQVLNNAAFALGNSRDGQELDRLRLEQATL